MKLTLKLIIVVGGLVMLATCADELIRAKRTVSRLERNNAALAGSLDSCKLENGKMAYSIQALEVTRKQFEQICAEQKEEIAALGIKVRRLQNMSRTATVTKVDTTARFIQDTLPRINIDSLPELPRLAGKIEWSDPWVSLKVRLDGEEAAVSIESVDTLLQVVHRVPRRFLGIPYGCKAIRQEITSSNPHTRVVYAEYIELKKRIRK